MQKQLVSCFSVLGLGAFLACSGCQPAANPSSSTVPTTSPRASSSGKPGAAPPSTTVSSGVAPTSNSGSTALPVLAQVRPFHLQNIDGAAVTDKTLAGHPYIIDFMFTTCTDFCPGMTEQMGKVRKALGQHSSVRTVSVSVDPEHDGPDRLKSYANEHKALDARWFFLTGERKVIMGMMVDMHLASQVDIDNPNPKLHNTRFILVDGQGQVRGYYSHSEPDAQQRLLKDVTQLDATTTTGETHP